jgi:hypothetical protein
VTKDEEINPADEAPEEVPPEEDADEHLDGDGQSDAADKNLYADELEEDEKDRNDLQKFVEGEHGKKVQQSHHGQEGWSQKYRNKGYNNGYKGNNKKQYGKGWHGKGWQKGKGKGKSKGYRWPKWHQDWNYNREDWGKHQWWDWDEGATKEQDAGVVLQQCKKGGYYLPKGQGYLDPDGNFHPQLGFNQSFPQRGESTPISKHMGRKRYIGRSFSGFD